jgi:hypothetical protein
VGPPSCAVAYFRWLISGGFLCGDFVGGGGVDIEGPNHGRSLHQVLYGLLHRVELLALVALGILARIPEAEGEDAIRLRVGDDHGLADESDLPLQNGQNLVIDGVAQLARLSGLAGQFRPWLARLSTCPHGEFLTRFEDA